MSQPEALLDWEQFRDRFFPLSRRHDLEAITAYDTYRRNAAATVDSSVRTAPLDQPV